jgi:hypothetical protein
MPAKFGEPAFEGVRFGPQRPAKKRKPPEEIDDITRFKRVRIIVKKHRTTTPFGSAQRRNSAKSPFSAIPQTQQVAPWVASSSLSREIGIGTDILGNGRILTEVDQLVTHHPQNSLFNIAAGNVGHVVNENIQNPSSTSSKPILHPRIDSGTHRPEEQVDSNEFIMKYWQISAPDVHGSNNDPPLDVNIESIPSNSTPYIDAVLHEDHVEHNLGQFLNDDAESPFSDLGLPSPYSPSSTLGDESQYIYENERRYHGFQHGGMITHVSSDCIR